MTSPSITFGILSRTSFEQIMNNMFAPPDRLALPLSSPPSAAPPEGVVNPDSAAVTPNRFAFPLPIPDPLPVVVTPSLAISPPPETKKGALNNRERCIATTLEPSQCKNWAKPTLSYCYAHRGLSSTKNVDCPICLEKFANPNDIFLLACAHQLHKECMAQLRTDTCPVCRSCLTNLPKDLNAQIRTRKNQDTTERNEEELQDALHRLGNGMNIFFSPFFMSSRGERTGSPPPQVVWPGILTYPSSISITDIFEDFIVRQNAERSSQPE